MFNRTFLFKKIYLYSNTNFIRPYQSLTSKPLKIHPISWKLRVLEEHHALLFIRGTLKWLLHMFTNAFWLKCFLSSNPLSASSFPKVLYWTFFKGHFLCLFYSFKTWQSAKQEKKMTRTQKYNYMNKEMNEEYSFENPYELVDCFTLTALQLLGLCLTYI